MAHMLRVDIKAAQVSTRGIPAYLNPNSAVRRSRRYPLSAGVHGLGERDSLRALDRTPRRTFDGGLPSKLRGTPDAHRRNESRCGDSPLASGVSSLPTSRAGSNLEHDSMPGEVLRLDDVSVPADMFVRSLMCHTSSTIRR